MGLPHLMYSSQLDLPVLILSKPLSSRPLTSKPRLLRPKLILLPKSKLSSRVTRLVEPKPLFWINLRSILSSIRWRSLRFSKTDPCSMPLFLNFPPKLSSVNSRELAESKPVFPSLPDMLLQHPPLIPFSMDSRTFLLSLAQPDLSSRKQPNSLLQRRTPQLLELQVAQQRLLRLLRKRKKSQKLSTWATFSAEMTNTESS